MKGESWLAAVSDKVARQQEVGNALAHGVLVPAGATHELALDHLRLEQQPVQVAERLGVRAQGLRRGRRSGQRWEAELRNSGLRVSHGIICRLRVLGGKEGECAFLGRVFR